MLKAAKNYVANASLTKRTGFIGLFIVTALAGFGLPYFSLGSGGTAAAASNLTATASASQAASMGSAVYSYHEITLTQAYPFYIAASFMIAGGLSVYALSYVPARIARRSRYASRFTTVARTTY